MTHIEVMHLFIKCLLTKVELFCNFSTCELLYSAQKPRLRTKAKWRSWASEGGRGDQGPPGFWNF